jgi:DDE superfamily endonuclease
MSSQDDSRSQDHFTQLVQFRQAAYGCLGHAQDALFELTDAVLQSPHLQSFVELSCAPAFRRKWSSAYEALQDGRPNRTELMKLYLQHLPPSERLVLAIDHTAWPRLWAETLPERSYQHQPSGVPGQPPITIGHGYSSVVVLPERSGSWALPLVHERFSDRKPVQKAAAQLRQVCAFLPVRPLALLDTEYGCADFLLATREVPADKLMRLRTNLVLEGPTRPYLGHGPHPIHGIPFRFKDPSTWWAPEQQWAGTDERYGPFIIRVWSGLRFAKALDLPLDVVCVEHPQAKGTRRSPKFIWFGWMGEPPPEQWWQIYDRRFGVEHWYRFAKNRLHWLLPRVATPEQGERWSDLMPLLTWELWLARSWVQDRPLPWQKPLPALSPGRVCQGLGALLPLLGTPTQVCKPRGVAPGWPTGQSRTKRAHPDLLRSEKEKVRRAHRRPTINGQKPKPGRLKQKPPPLPA